MEELTLEAVVKRLEAVEKQLAELTAATAQPRKKDWRRVVGMSEDNEFTRLMRAEIEANREAARRESADEPHVVE